MNIQIDTPWPATLPLPTIDYAGTPINSTLFSATQSDKIDRRSRTTRTYVSIKVTWALDDTEYSAFKEFFKTTLDIGTSQFSIELRYPKNSVLTTWAARFSEGYQVDYGDGVRIIGAQLDLVNPHTLPEVATPL
jgi:hypothetical protein